MGEGLSSKDTIMAWIAFLAIIATGFVSIRNEVREVTVQVAKVTAQVETLHDYCCGEME